MGYVRVTIYHGYEEDGRMVFDLDQKPLPAIIVRAYSYLGPEPPITGSAALGSELVTREIPEALEKVFLDNNAGAPGGADLSIKFETRSLSVGDIVQFSDVDGSSFHLVQHLGFADLTLDEFMDIPLVTIGNVRERIQALTDKTVTN